MIDEEEQNQSHEIRIHMRFGPLFEFSEEFLGILKDVKAPKVLDVQLRNSK